MKVGRTAVLGGDAGRGIFASVALLRRLCFILAGSDWLLSPSFPGGERVSIDSDRFLLMTLNPLLRLFGLGDPFAFSLFPVDEERSVSTDSTEYGLDKMTLWESSDWEKTESASFNPSFMSALPKMLGVCLSMYTNRLT